MNLSVIFGFMVAGWLLYQWELCLHSRQEEGEGQRAKIPVLSESVYFCEEGNSFFWESHRYIYLQYTFAYISLVEPMPHSH